MNAADMWRTRMFPLSCDSYIHAKYMLIDKKVLMVGSVNWSHASYMGNREASAFIQGDDAESLITFSDGIFEEDWAAAIPLQVTQTYSQEEMDIITDPSPIPVVIPPIPPIHSGRFITPTPYAVDGSYHTQIYTSPDYADATLLADINSAQQNLTIHMYVMPRCSRPSFRTFTVSVPVAL